MSFVETSWCHDHTNYPLNFLPIFQAFSQHSLQKVAVIKIILVCCYQRFGDVKTDDVTSLNLSAVPNVDWSRHWQS